MKDFNAGKRERVFFAGRGKSTHVLLLTHLIIHSRCLFGHLILLLNKKQQSICGDEDARVALIFLLNYRNFSSIYSIKI